MKKTVYKILSVILMVFLIMSPLSTVAAKSANIDELRDLMILPDKITGNDLDRAVTRDEFAYMATHLIEREDFIAVDTRFTDVDKTNEYSGHIEFLASIGILNGVTETEFNPGGNLSAIMAYKIAVKILGYDSLAEELGGYPDGYTKVAEQLGITSVVAPNEEILTVNKACNLVYEVLTQEYPAVNYAVKDGKIISYSGNSTFSVLNRLKISSYTGVIKKISKDAKNIQFEITKNNYDTNYVLCSKGEVITLDVKNGIDAYEYENIPISVYVDESGKIISVTKNKHFSVMYTYITGVNGDSDKDAAYASELMTKMSLVGIEDDFSVADDFTLSMAGIFTTSQVKVIGNFAKIVLYDDEIYYADVWETQEGGLITEITANDISYIDSNGFTRKLKNISDYEEYFIYINGERTDLNQLKTNSVFDYWISGDRMMITASEKVISDVLYQIAKNKVEISSMYYTFEKLYYSVDSDYKEYKQDDADSEIYHLLGKDVTAYFAPDGMVRFITKTGDIDTGEFYGVVLGVNPINLSEEAEIKILSLYPSQETAVYKLTEKTAYDIGLSRDVLGNGSHKGGDFDGNGIYMFKKNSKNEIVAVNHPEYIKGFGDGPIMKSGMTQIPSSYATLNGKPYFFSESPIVAVYESNNALSAKIVDYNSIYERVVENATMVFFGEDIVKNPELVVLCGNLRKAGDRSITRGIVTEKQQALDSNGEIAWEIEVLVRGGGTETYVLSDEEANGINKYSLLAYYKNQLFSDTPIYISSVVELADNPEKWQALIDGKTIAFQKGTVVAISDSRLCVENDGVISVNCMHPSRCIIAEVDEAHPANRFKAVEYGDIEPGDIVYYDLCTEGIEAIIAVH